MGKGEALADDPVQFPGQPVDKDARDLAEPLRQILIGLGLLESPEDKVTLRGTPQSLQVIKAGALSVTKAWTILTGTAGFAGFVAALVGAWKASSDELKIALIGGASLILAATALAIALIVRGDVGARAATTIDLYRARAAVSASFLPAALAASGSKAEEGDPDGLAQILAAFKVDVANENPHAGLYGVRRRSGRPLEVRRGDGDWVAVDRDTPFEIQAPIPPA